MGAQVATDNTQHSLMMSSLTSNFQRLIFPTTNPVPGCWALGLRAQCISEERYAAQFIHYSSLRSSPVSKLCIARGKVDRLAKKMIFDRKVQKKEEKIGVTSGHLFGHPKKLQAYWLKWAMSGMEASQFSAQTKTNICIALWWKKHIVFGSILFN